MRILFFMRHAGYVRNFERMLQLLAERGHEITLAFDTRTPRWLEAQDPLEGLPSASVAATASPSRLRGTRGDAAEALRLSLDYMRYLEPEYAGAPKLRRRAEKRAPRAMQSFGRSRLARRSRVRNAVAHVLGAAERSLGHSPEIDRFLASHRPDVVLITPFVGLGSDQVEYLRAARGRGVPAGVCVASWDNLTNKGVIREPPDLVAVWNEPQREEAIRLHGVPAGHVTATGAHSYDHWFEWQPARDREEFCRRVGLDPARPFLLYVCSSSFVAPDEVSFVRDWLTSLRADGSPARETGVLIRPHPQNAAQWAGASLTEHGDVRIWPRSGAVPVDEAARADYFDSVYHCSAVVGLNTSALIESAIIGRPVFTVLDERYRETQTGTLHFAHIADGEEALLTVARSFDEHLGQLEAVLAPGAAPSRPTAFLETFVRPHGLDRPAAPFLVEAVERLRSTPPATGAEASPVVGAVAHVAVDAVDLARMSRPAAGRVVRRVRRVRRKAVALTLVLGRRVRSTL